MAHRERRSSKIGPLTNIHREPEGWTVVVIRGGIRFSDYFGDAVWGGRGPALVAAQHFRDRLMKRIGGDGRTRSRVPAGRTSTTGVVGVSRETHPVGGRVYHRFVATWPDASTGRMRRRRFQIERYGKQAAFELALEARREGVARRLEHLGKRQREDAERRLALAAPMPRQVKDPRSRKGIRMPRRRRQASR